MTVLQPRPLDPRPKLAACLSAAAALMALGRWEHLAAALGALLVAAALLRLGQAWLRFLKVLGFAVITFLAIAWVAFDLPTGLSAALRLTTVATVFFLLFQTTPPERLSNALAKMGLPYAFNFVLTASMQFVDVLARKAGNVRDAQRARGIPLDGGWSTIRHLPALLGPLLIQAFKLADELAEAMEARGFGAPGRTFRHAPVLRGADWAVLAASVGVLAILCWLRLR